MTSRIELDEKIKDDQKGLRTIFRSNLLLVINAQQFSVIGHFNFQIAHFIEKDLTAHTFVLFH